MSDSAMDHTWHFHTHNFIPKNQQNSECLIQETSFAKMKLPVQDHLFGAHSLHCGTPLHRTHETDIRFFG